MKPRYAKQLLKMDCVPIAFTNLFKWAGNNLSYKEIRFHLYKILNFNYSMGTSFDSYESVLKEGIKGFLIIKKFSIKPKSFVQHLNNKGCIMFTYLTENGGFHTALIVGFDQGKFQFVNHREDKTISLISVKKLRKYLKKQNIIHFITQMKKVKARKWEAGGTR